MKIPNWLIVVIVIVTIIGIHSVGRYEYRRGLDVGYGVALDTVDVILKERVRNTPPAITELKLDTVKYYLYRKLADKLK